MALSRTSGSGRGGITSGDTSIRGGAVHLDSWPRPYGGGCWNLAVPGSVTLPSFRSLVCSGPRWRLVPPSSFPTLLSFLTAHWSTAYIVCRGRSSRSVQARLLAHYSTVSTSADSPGMRRNDVQYETFCRNCESRFSVCSHRRVRDVSDVLWVVSAWGEDPFEV